MGVKSTVRLTRAEAEQRYINYLIQPPRTLFSNEQLADILERMNDEVHGGQGFENYVITDD
jgi:hypothetical protein